MSIIINIKYIGKNNNAKDFANEMIKSGIVDEIRKENGNLRYEYYLPLNDNNFVLLIDEWENQDALDIHHNSSIMKRIIKLREKYDLKMEVERYLKIQNEIKDEKYIRK